MIQLRKQFMIFFVGAFFVFSTRVQAQIAVVNELFGRALGRHVNENGIDFLGFKEDPDFQEYLKAIADLDSATLKINSKPDATPDERKEDLRYQRRRMISFWINAYNALTIKAIADRYDGKLKSVKQIRSFYRDPIAPVGGKPRSLSEIEDAILIRELDEPRAIFLLYRGMVGGPRLPAAPISAIDLEAELFEGMKAFFQDPDNYRLDTLGKVLWLPDFLKPVDRELGGHKSTIKLVAPYFKRTRETRFVQAEEVALKFFVTESALMSPPPKKKDTK